LAAEQRVWRRYTGKAFSTHGAVDIEHLLSFLLLQQAACHGVEFEAFDDASEHLAECPGARAILACGPVFNQKRRLVGNCQGDTCVFEIVDRNGPDGARNVASVGIIACSLSVLRAEQQIVLRHQV